LPAGFRTVDIAPLEPEAVQVFLRRWCAAVYPDDRDQAEKHLGERQDERMGMRRTGGLTSAVPILGMLVAAGIGGRMTGRGLVLADGARSSWYEVA
jgi:hypothetical protein